MHITVLSRRPVRVWGITPLLKTLRLAMVRPEVALPAMKACAQCEYSAHVAMQQTNNSCGTDELIMIADDAWRN
jgi:hypothetical protein